MRKCFWLVVTLFLLTSCQPHANAHVTILADGKTVVLATTERLPRRLLAQAKVTLGENDRLLYLGTSTPLDTALPEANNYFLEVRRAVALTLVGPDGQQIYKTSAQTIGQALTENGVKLYAADELDPPAETPITAPLTVNYTPSRLLTVSLDTGTVTIRSAASTVGQALTGAGMPLEGLDTSQPDEAAPLPADGRIQVNRIVETVTLTQRAIPFNTLTQPSADLNLDQQTLLQGGQAGLAVSRVRVRSQDGVEVSRQTEAEAVVQAPQDRVVGYGTKITIRTLTTPDGQTLQYWRVLSVYATSFSPCGSAGIPGKCYYYTPTHKLVQKGIAAFVYSWYILMTGWPVYVLDYGSATIETNGGGWPPGNHYWIDLGYTDADYVPWSGWTTLYFLTPVPPNIPYLLP